MRVGSSPSSSAWGFLFLFAVMPSKRGTLATLCASLISMDISVVVGSIGTSRFSTSACKRAASGFFKEMTRGWTWPTLFASGRRLRLKHQNQVGQLLLRGYALGPTTRARGFWPQGHFLRMRLYYIILYIHTYIYIYNIYIYNIITLVN
ncbi:unnamed protein product [Cladocopium goreaui]|uniref:Uncharacterized protein n=1 Tax=Cladocopium goreaui TaxID=2562237 RepID=A0A9P1C6I4_9DINO|nr:unnamed protein product [Cladocopium goreaui]